MKLNIYGIEIINKYGLSFWDKLLGRHRNLYWIEYRVDEDRFWYCHKRGRKIITSHHTKNDFDKSVEIVKGIEERAESFGWKPKELYNRLSLKDHIRRVDLLNKQKKLEKEKQNSIFLNE